MRTAYAVLAGPIGDPASAESLALASEAFAQMDTAGMTPIGPIRYLGVDGHAIGVDLEKYGMSPHCYAQDYDDASAPQWTEWRERGWEA